VTTLEEFMNGALASDRLLSQTATALGLFSIVLMAAGLFGALHYAVTQRTRELGLRMALGASPEGIRRLMLGHALKVAVWGLPVGLGLLAELAWLARATVLGVRPSDPWVYAGAAVVVSAIVLAAAWLPARRATRVDPMEALRAE